MAAFTWHTAYLGARVIYQAFNQDHCGIVARLGRSTVLIKPEDNPEPGLLIRRNYHQIRFAPRRPATSRAHEDSL